jgi:hypothetical protein
LELNVARFSAAKSYQATQLIQRQRADGDGVVRNDVEYKKAAKAVLEVFNRHQATEYNAAVARSRTAKQWIDFTSDEMGNLLFPNIKWIPSRSATPREEHIPFYNKVWAKKDPFWQINPPGTAWGCECDWIETDDPVDGITTEIVPVKGLKGNPAETGEVFSPDASYFTVNANKNIVDTFYEDRLSSLKINVTADKSEIGDNVRTGRILLENFKDMDLQVRKHIRDQRKGVIKNPEYLLNGIIADAKRLDSWNVASGFLSAKSQKCEIVILDLYKLQGRSLKIDELAKNIVNRHNDFSGKTIKECYVIWKNKSVVVKADLFNGFVDDKKIKALCKTKIIDILRVLL